MELISKKNYKLINEANYFDLKGEIKKTKEVTLHCLKMEDSDKLMDLIDKRRSDALELLCNKGYIAPLNAEGKIKSNDLDFRVAMDLLGEYSMSFLDLSSFSKIK